MPTNLGVVADHPHHDHVAVRAIDMHRLPQDTFAFESALLIGAHGRVVAFDHEQLDAAQVPVAECELEQFPDGGRSVTAAAIARRTDPNLKLCVEAHGIAMQELAGPDEAAIR